MTTTRIYEVCEKESGITARGAKDLHRESHRRRARPCTEQDLHSRGRRRRAWHAGVALRWSP